jgi:hypothetical protein
VFSPRAFRAAVEAEVGSDPSREKQARGILRSLDRALSDALELLDREEDRWKRACGDDWRPRLDGPYFSMLGRVGRSRLQAWRAHVRAQTPAPRSRDPLATVGLTRRQAVIASLAQVSPDPEKRPDSRHCALASLVAGADIPTPGTAGVTVADVITRETRTMTEALESWSPTRAKARPT